MPKEQPDRDIVIASLLFQLCVENDNYRNEDKDGNLTVRIADSYIAGNRGYDAVLTREKDAVRLTLKR